MKVLCGLVVVLILRQATAAIIRKPPAFSTPMYSNSYLPAAMQVIFHAVEQLKLLQLDGISQQHSTTNKPSSTIQSMKYQQSQSTMPGATSTISPATTHDKKTEILEQSPTSPAVLGISSHESSEAHGLTRIPQHVEISTANVLAAATNSDYEESPEVNEETAEANYATPETHHESPEPVQESQKSNQEVSEENEEKKSSTTESISGEMSKVEAPQQDDISRQQSTEASGSDADKKRKKEPTIDSVVDEIYEIVKPTISPLIDESDDDESKSATGISIEKMESIEDEEEETRFTLLGEKVAQVPRPSLSSYLRRTKVPPSRAIQQLASLYDALSKDARKQGFACFTGYTDEVLKTLQSSAEGGIGPQLKKLLEKVIERNELTRNDARVRTSQALRDLDDPASLLNKDLRRLLPLRYTV